MIWGGPSEGLTFQFYPKFITPTYWVSGAGITNNFALTHAINLCQMGPSSHTWITIVFPFPSNQLVNGTFADQSPFTQEIHLKVHLATLLWRQIFFGIPGIPLFWLVDYGSHNCPSLPALLLRFPNGWQSNHIFIWYHLDEILKSQRRKARLGQDWRPWSWLVWVFTHK